MTRPSHTPSWLTLERYALGELAPEQRAEVDRALANDSLARDCLASIQSSARALPPLPSSPKAIPAQPWWRSLASWRLGLVATAVAGVALALLVPRAVMLDDDAVQSEIRGAKGDDVVLSLVRERAGEVAFDPGTFAVGDRIKVRVTCAAAAPRIAQVAVYQDGEASFPLPAELIHCGNLVVLPGAFEIDAQSPAEICVVVGENAADVHRELAAHPQRGPHTDCVTLQATK